jgi:hypothetical protein
MIQIFEVFDVVNELGSSYRSPGHDDITYLLFGKPHDQLTLEDLKDEQLPTNITSSDSNK